MNFKFFPCGERNVPDNLGQYNNYRFPLISVGNVLYFYGTELQKIADVAVKLQSDRTILDTNFTVSRLCETLQQDVLSILEQVLDIRI